MRPTPDLILQFSLPLSSHEAVKEYTTLLKTLKDANLKVTSRWGKSKQEVLVFVKAKEGMVREWREAERVSDWMNGIPPSATENDSLSARSFVQSPVTTAERIRLLHSFITHSKSSSTNGITGLGISPDNGFPHLKDIFPPHDHEFNREWLREWGGSSENKQLSLTQLISIPDESLVRIKNHFGESIALYFEFLRFYFFSLIFPAILGLFTWATLGEYSSFYSTGIILWGIVLTQAWKVRERNLAVNWGVASTSKVLMRRSHQSKKEAADVEKEEDDDHRVWIRKQLRIFASVPAVLVFAAFLAALISCIYTIEIVLTEVYNGPFKQYLTLVPTILFVGLVPQVVNVWATTASKLVEWENHQHQINFERSLTLKMFALTFFVSYGGLFLTSYIYTPFASLIVPKIISFIHLPVHADGVDSKQAFSFNINSDRLHKQMFAYTATNQVVNTFLEVIMPILTRKGMKTMHKVEDRFNGKETPASATLVDDDGPDAEEKEWLRKIREESQLPEYSLFVDFSEMVIQLGYITIWSVVLPLAPVFALINNFFELRGDAFKLCVNSKRPIPKRTDTVGPWLTAMEFLLWIASITNSSIIYLFTPHPSSEFSNFATSEHSHINPGISNTTSTLTGRALSYVSSKVFLASQHPHAYESIKSVLFSSLLVGLASEHVYFIVRFFVQTAVERLLWTGGKAHRRLRNNEVLVKKRFLESSGAGTGASPKGNGSEGFVEVEKEEAEAAFWNFEPKGIEEVKKLVKSE
ncbi:DUF590-domain-containing protein [Atractiella rhizophila]|nr:DUF590-domain-containing protein [Atractiella rhizophila]